MDLSALFTGFALVLSLQNVGLTLLGVLLGTFVGVLPGLGPASTVALLFPLLVHLPPIGAIIMLCGIYYGAQYGGSTTAILVNVPGEVSSVVVCMDGYAMTRSGRPGPALAIAAIGSFIAGTLSLIVLTLLAPRLANIALTFGPPEYFAIMALSLMSIISFAGKSILKGVLAALFGMFIASSGTDPMTGLARLTFGSTQLRGGLDLVPVVVGLFGFAEVFTMLEKPGSVFLEKIGRLMPSKDELGRGFVASLRGGIVGAALGVLPGMAPAMGSFLAYDLEKRVSHHPERFGTGVIEGVAAPEAANNSTAISGMIPMMSLGIPTSPTLALILAALILYGVQPGPLMFTQHSELAWSVIAGLYLGNVMLLVLNLPLVGVWARMCNVPRHIMAGAVLVLCFIASWVSRFRMFDCWVMLIAGLLGHHMQKRRWPHTALVLGFILGPLTEQSLRQTLSMYKGSILQLFERPLFDLLLGAALLALIAGIRLLRRTERGSREEKWRLNAKI